MIFMVGMRITTVLSAVHLVLPTYIALPFYVNYVTGYDTPPGKSVEEYTKFIKQSITRANIFPGLYN